MAVYSVSYAKLVVKDKNGNYGVVNSLTESDIKKIKQGLADVALTVDATTHKLITADTTKFGAVKLADAAAIAAGTAGLAVDAAALKAVRDGLTNGVHYKGSVAEFSALPAQDSDTPPQAGDMYNVVAAFSLNGVNYPAGTNVIAYYTTGDKDAQVLNWDALDGDPSGYARQSVANTFTATNTFNADVVVAPAQADGTKPKVNMVNAALTVSDALLDTTNGAYSPHAAVNASVLNAALDSKAGAAVNYVAADQVPGTFTSLPNNTVSFFAASNLLD